MIKKTWKKALAGICATIMVVTGISWPAMTADAAAVSNKKLDESTMKVSASSTDTTETGVNKSPENVLDESDTTFWASVENGKVSEQWFVVELDKIYSINQVDYTMRNANNYDATGNLNNCIVSVSKDNETWEEVANVTTTKGTTVIEFEAVEAKYVKITSTDSYHWQKPNTVMCISELDIYRVFPKIDESTMKVSVSSTDTTETGVNKSPENVLDGSDTTFWASVENGKVSEQWFIVELDNIYSIEQVDYTMRNANSYNATGNLNNCIVSVSKDKETWTEVANVTTTKGTTVIEFGAVEAKYVKITSTDSYHWQSPNTVMCISELDIYGVPVKTSAAAKLTNATASLKGKIDVNFYVEVNDASALDDLSVKLTRGDDVVTYEFTDEAFTDDGLYRFTYDVAAKEMTDAITAELMNGEEIISTASLSVKEYTNALKEYYEGKEDFEKLEALLDAMLNYGAAAQNEFGYNTADLANDGVEKDFTNTVITVADPVIDKGIDAAVVDVSNVSLLLKSDTTLRFYLKAAEGVDLSTYTVDPALAEGETYAEFTDIAAKDLDEVKTFTVTDGTNTTTVKYSPLNYAKAVVDSETTSSTLKTVAKALYEYNVCADAYFGE